MLLHIVFVSILGLFVLSIILFCFWGHSRFYKRNFPVDSISLQLMSEKDRKKLHKWVNSFVPNNNFQEYKVYEKIRRGTYDGLSSAYIIDKHTEEIISSLALSIKEHRAITGELELIILNQIIYRHKYNALLSMFVFPISDELIKKADKIKKRKQIKSSEFPSEITKRNLLLEKCAEEIENCYGRDTELTEEIRDLLNAE